MSGNPIIFAYVYLVDSFLFQYEINDTNSRNQLSLWSGDIYIPYMRGSAAVNQFAGGEYFASDGHGRQMISTYLYSAGIFAFPA